MKNITCQSIKDELEKKIIEETLARVENERDFLKLMQNIEIKINNLDMIVKGFDGQLKGIKDILGLQIGGPNGSSKRNSGRA
jgi:hypothetical protein